MEHRGACIRSIHFFVVAIGHLFALAGVGAMAQCLPLRLLAFEADTRPLTLVHRFDIPVDPEWTTISIRLASGAWRVDGITGPAAMPGQMRAVVEGLVSLQIGGRCEVQHDGGTTYPCSLALRDVQFGGAMSEGVTLVASEIQSPTSLTTIALPRVAWHAPVDFIDRVAWEDGGTLTFTIRGAPNPLAPSRIDRASGLVVVQGRVPIRLARADEGIRQPAMAGS